MANRFLEAFNQGRSIGGAARERMVTNKLAEPLAGGDYSGAAKIAFEQGRPDMGMTFDTQAREMAAADAKAARDTDENFRNNYSTVVDAFGRIDALRSRGVLDGEKYQAALMNTVQNLKPLVSSDPKLAEMMPDLLQRVNSSPPGTIAAYNEEYAKTLFDEASPTAKAELDIKKGTAALANQKFKLDARKLDLEIEKFEKDIDGGVMPELADVLKVQDRFEKQAKTFEEAQRQFNTMANLSQDATGASDVALGFAFFKTIDPDSTVREGEFAQAAGAMGIGGRVTALMKSLDKGEKFTPTLRGELVKAAKRAYDEQKTDMQALQARTARFAERYQIPAEDVTRNVVRGPTEGAPGAPPPELRDGTGGVAAAPQGAPAIGAIEDGYRFLGGNPADPSSWEQA